MLLSIENARKTLPNGCLALSICNVMAVSFFIAPLFKDFPARYFVTLMVIAACIGLVMGLYFKFRSDGGTASAFFRVFYFLISMELFVAGGAAATAVWIAGRRDLGWLAFFINCLVAVLLLLGGMYREAKALGWWRANIPGRWKSELEKYIDYSTYQVNPSLTHLSSDRESRWAISWPWTTAIGSANIPLLFEIYGGGRNNSVFIAIPMIMFGLAYLNLKNFGPGFVRLLLLRKLERENGRRFINADLEQIQELRRTFFLSRWLMKGYVAPQPIQQILTKRQKNHS